MIQPGSKNWIDKYFYLIETKKVDLTVLTPPKSLTESEFLHNVFFDTGIIFGYPIDFLFYKKDEISLKWTTDEKTSLLLLECLLAVYITQRKDLKKEDFVSSLLNFYQQYKAKYSINVLKLFFKDKSEDQLEKIIKSRVHIKKTLSNQLWFNYFNNSLVYLDVLAFHSFLINDRKLEECYDAFVLGTLNTIGFMSSASDKVEDIQKYTLSIFLDASELNENEKKEFLQKTEDKKLKVSDIKIPKEVPDLYKLYLIDMAVLAVNSDISTLKNKMPLLNKLRKHIGISNKRLEYSIMNIHRFVMENNHRITFLQEKSSYEQLYGNFSKRWIKVLGRNKDKLVEELKESKELISLVNKSLTEELTAEEKEKVKEQFKDIVKSVPALAIFMLPGGMILLPLILKIIPDLIPSAFKKNEM